MAEKVVSVRLQARVEGFTAGMRKAKASVDDLTKADVPKAAKGYKDLADKAALAGVAMAVGLGLAVKRFADFDQAMSAVKANTGGTVKEMDALRQAAIQLGADSQFSATEAAQGINELGKAGIKTGDILTGGLKGALDLAAAGQITVAQAAETTASAMTQFGLKGDKAVHVADLLASGANKAQGGVGDLGAALGQAGLVAAATGLSIEETTAGLTAFASAGLIGSDAGTSFKTMLQRLNAPSAEAAGVMKDLGISAYDSQGNFVGLANVAEQLKTGMEDLTPAQRNAAMATIFGSDAVRASTILYEQGADGINKWTAAVDDQGAAARQAAALTDNLSGDIERLGGAFDTALIQTGSGANESLRTLVQGLEGLVNVVAKIPGPVLLAGTGLAAIALVVPNSIVAFRKYTATLDSVGLSFDKISARGPKAAKAINGVGKAAKGLGIIAAGLAAGGVVDQIFGPDTNRDGAEVITRDLLAADDAVAAFSDRMQTFADKSSNWWSSNQVTNYGDAVNDVFNPSAAQKIDNFAGSLTSVFGIDNNSDIANAGKSLKDLDGVLSGLVSSGNADEADLLFRQFADAAGLQGVEVDKLMTKLPGYDGLLAGVDNTAKLAAGSTGAMADSTEDLRTETEKAIEATNEFVDALAGLNQPNLDLRDAQRQVQEALQGTKDVVGDLREKLIEKAKEDGKSEKAAKKWADAQIAAGVALNKNRTEFDITTEAGRAYQEAIDGLATAHQGQIDKMAEAGASQSDLDAALRTSRAELYDTAIRMGLTKDAARLYVEQVLKIPPAKHTDVTVSLPTAAVEAFQAKLNGLHGKDIRINVRYNAGTLPNGGRDQSGGTTKDAWNGGAIYGPGTGTSDSIPARLSNGEHVWTAAEVRRLGGQSAMYALRNAVMQGRVPKFANGGAVQYAPPVSYGGPTSYATTNDSRLVADVVNIMTQDANSFKREIRTAPYRAKARPGR